jgi:hypothetical protein
MKKSEKELRDTVRELTLELTAIQNRLHAQKLVLTAHALTAAMNTMGWEVAEKLTKKRKGIERAPLRRRQSRRLGEGA